MDGSKVFQLVFLISCGIFSTHALDVLLTDGQGIFGFKYETQIEVRVGEKGMKYYKGCVINNTYTARNETTKVIVYIKSYDPMKKKTLRQKWLTKRSDIKRTLRAHDYEMLYLGVLGFDQGDGHLVAEFLHRTIQSNSEQPRFKINTIGEKTMNLTYKTPSYKLNQYQEEEDVFEGDLLGELRSMNT